MMKELSILLAAIMTMGLILTGSTPCAGADLSVNGGLELDKVSFDLRDFVGNEMPETIYEQKIYLKVNLWEGEPVGGFVWLQYLNQSEHSTDGQEELTAMEAYLDLIPKSDCLLRIGKQRLTWGSGFCWNPTNYLGADKNRADLTAENQGVELFNLRMLRGDTSLSILIKPQTGLDDWGYAIQYAWRAGRWDFAVSGFGEGKADGFGYDISTATGNWVFYNEAAWKSGGDRFYFTDGGNGPAQTTRPDDRYYLHQVFGVNYNFGTDLMVQMEYYFNGEGWNEQETAQYNLWMENPALTSGDREKLGREVSSLLGDLHRNYLFVSVRKSGLWDDVTFSAGLLMNLDDRSYQLTPMLDYQWKDNISFRLMIVDDHGSMDTEFGSQIARYTIGLRMVMSF